MCSRIENAQQQVMGSTDGAERYRHGQRSTNPNRSQEEIGRRLPNLYVKRISPYSTNNVSVSMKQHICSLFFAFSLPNIGRLSVTSSSHTIRREPHGSIFITRPFRLPYLRFVLFASCSCFVLVPCFSERSERIDHGKALSIAFLRIFFGDGRGERRGIPKRGRNSFRYCAPGFSVIRISAIESRCQFLLLSPFFRGSRTSSRVLRDSQALPV